MKHWDVVCKKCNRMLVDGEWVDAGLPTHGRVTTTICPDCQPAEQAQPKKSEKPKSSGKGMVFQQLKRAKAALSKRFSS